MTNIIQKKWVSFYRPFSKYVKNSLSNQIFSEQAGELVFILVLFLTITYKNDLLTFSQNLLGKLFLFILVVYFFIIQPKFGLFISIVLILYYYSDLIQSYYHYEIPLNNWKNNQFENQYENMSNPIITKQIDPSQFPFFEGKFIGTLKAENNTILSIHTDMSGNLKEYLTKFENDLIIHLEKGVNYDTGDNHLLKIPNIETSFSYVDGFMKGYFNYYDQNKKYIKGDFTGRLTGKVAFQRNKDAIIFKMKSLDSNVRVIKQINNLENTNVNNMEDLSGCVIFQAVMKTGTITFNKNNTINLPTTSDGILMFSGFIKSPLNSLDPTKSVISLIKTYQNYPDPLAAYILSINKNQIFTASITGTFMALYLPPNVNITSFESIFSNIKILQGKLTCDAKSRYIISNKIQNYGMLNVVMDFTKANIIPFDTNNYQNLPTQISLFTTLSNSNSNSNSSSNYITTDQSIKENMETSQIKDAYPFTKDLVTIPSKFYTQYNYELPSTVYEKTQKESFFSDFFKKILSSSENPKEAFTTEPINIPHQKEYPNNSYLSQTQNTLSPQTQNDLQNNQIPNPNVNPQIDQFRKSYCINQQLMYKNTPVHPEIAEYIFPNIQINDVAGSNGVNCNPCDPTCPILFSNMDQRLENENIIQKRTRNEYNNHTQDSRSNFFDVFLPNPIYPEFNSSTKPSNSSYLIPANARITNGIQ